MYWKKWAAKHAHEELKEDAWLEPAPALLRKKVGKIGSKIIAMWLGRSFWKEVGRKKDHFETGWSDISQCQACQMDQGTEKHMLYHRAEWHAVRRDIREGFRNWEQKAKTTKRKRSRALSVEANGIEVTTG